MQKIKVVVIGASAGGVEALSMLVKCLPPGYPAAVFAVLHFPENATSVLPHILSRVSSLPAINPTDHEPIENGKIYVATPGCHLLVKPGEVRVVRGPKEQGHRPAIDPLFRTAAKSYGRACAGVILSGTLDDGVIGLNAIKKAGGVALVQDPDEALFPDMPKNAISDVHVDYVAKVNQLSQLLIELADGEEEEDPEESKVFDEPDPTEMDMAHLQSLERNGKPSAYTCPECNGTLFELSDEGIRYYRCRVGHAYTPESLEAHQTEELEAALWEALKTMEENLALARRLLERATNQERRASIQYYSEKVETGERRVELLRHVLRQTIEIGGSAEGP